MLYTPRRPPLTVIDADGGVMHYELDSLLPLHPALAEEVPVDVAAADDVLAYVYEDPSYNH